MGAKDHFQESVAPAAGRLPRGRGSPTRVGQSQCHRSSGGMQNAMTPVRNFPITRPPVHAAIFVIAVTGLARTTNADLQTMQISYADVAGSNDVLLEWLDPDGAGVDVEILRDGVSLGAVPASAGARSHEVRGEPTGLHTYQVRRGETSLGAREQEILSAQPFANPAGGDQFVCAERAGDESCDVVIDWINGFPIPSYFEVYLDGALVQTIEGFRQDAEVSGVQLGRRCVSVVGILEGPDQGYVGRFRGATLETCCPVGCGAPACAPPGELELAQVAHGAGTTNGVLARWRGPAGGYAGGVAVRLDGKESILLVGEASSFLIEHLTPGNHEVAVTGRCGDPAGDSTSTVAGILLLEENPHPAPIDGTVTCTWVPEEWGTTTFRWVSGTPSELVAVFREVEETLTLVEMFPGDFGEISIHHTLEGERFQLQYFVRVEGVLHGSPLIPCTRPESLRRFLRGVCNGSDGELKISSPIFGLQYLFSGGAEPPCRAACDTNGDENVDLSDMVAALLFLFQGGRPPSGWLDAGGDGQVDPTCEGARVELCAAANDAACPE